MRVAMIGFPSLEYTIELSEALAELVDIELMLPANIAERFKNVINRNLNLYPFYYPRMRYPTNMVMVYQILKRIFRTNPDIVHIQRGNPWFNFAIPFLNRYCIVSTIHNVIQIDWPSQRIPNFTYKPPIQYAEKIIVHGGKLKNDMEKEYGVSSDDIFILPRGVNSIYTRYVYTPVAEEDHTILYFGRIWEYKGLKYLIESEPLISKEIPDIKIIIAGTGENLDKYREMMVNKDRFIIRDEYIPNEEVNQLFQKASLVVLPYTDGSQSGVIPLAYAFKKPVVVTDVGSLRENVDHGVTGYVIPPRDSEKLAEVIIDLLKHREKRKRMGENAYKKTGETLSWKNIAVRTLDVYKQALSQKANK